jgi:hypothetical protein
MMTDRSVVAKPKPVTPIVESGVASGGSTLTVGGVIVNVETHQAAPQEATSGIPHENPTQTPTL